MAQDAARSSASGHRPAVARRRSSTRPGKYDRSGPLTQVSRLGNPLFNEVIVPMAEKDKWNLGRRPPTSSSPSTSTKPELAGPPARRCTRACSPTSRRTRSRAPISPRSCSPASRRASSPVSRTSPGTSGRHAAAQPRHPTAGDRRTPLGILGGDLAGFPNGRRLERRRRDDRAAGDGRCDVPAGRPARSRRTAPPARSPTAPPTPTPRSRDFPYLGLPGGGYQTVPGTPRRHERRPRPENPHAGRVRSSSTSAATSAPSW